MKKATKKLALVLVAAMVMGLCLVGCGSIVKDTLGDWCVDTVNGQPVAEYAAAAGVTEDMMQFNMKIEEDKIRTESDGELTSREIREAAYDEADKVGDAHIALEREISEYMGFDKTVKKKK